MKRFGLVVLVALVGVAAIGLVGGDPRGTHSMARSEAIALAGLVVCTALTLVAWRAARVSPWWIVPLGLVTVTGALCGWIAGVEFAGVQRAAVHLATAPGKVAFLVAMTVAGMSLPAFGVTSLARRLARSA